MCFGGGTAHGSGEDVLFIKDCLKKNLNVIAVPATLAKLNESRESTWFKGYDEKYFYDKGYLFACISKRYCKIISLLNLIKNRTETNAVGFVNALSYVFAGIADFRKR